MEMKKTLPNHPQTPSLSKDGDWLVLWIFTITTFVGGHVWGSASFAPDWEKISGKKLPDIIFTDSLEKEVRLSDYENKILILHPMFTHCPSTCLFLSSRLAAALKGLSAKERDSLRILSFSFDPGETAEGLLKFEKMFHVDRSVWKVVRAKPPMTQQMLKALDFRTLQLSKANFEHANLVFVVGTDRILRDYIFGSDLTPERLSRATRFTQSSYSRVLTLKSYVYIFAGIGLLISTFIAVQQLTKVQRNSH